MDMQLEEGEVQEPSEEGEIQDISEERDVSINPYNPLKRPLLHNEQRDNEDECGDHKVIDVDVNIMKRPGMFNSDSESDNEHIFSKRFKFSAPPGSKKYTVWSRDPNGDLNDDLNQVVMKEKTAEDISRSVECYPLPSNGDCDTNNRNLKFKRKKAVPVKGKYSKNRKPNFKKFTRTLESLEVNASNTIEEVAEDIATKLREFNKELILRIVIILGKDKAIQLYEKTSVIEKLGGMLISNGDRKRTSGGVFICLVRGDKELSDDKLKAIFEKDITRQKKKQKRVDKKRKRRKKKSLKNNKNEDKPSQLSNPPPSPDLPELPTRKHVLNGLDGLDQHTLSQSHANNGEENSISCDNLDFPEFI